MSDLGDKMIEGLRQTLQDLKEGKPLKVTTVGKVQLGTMLRDLGVVVSASESRRMVAQGAVKLNGVLHEDMRAEVFIRDGDVLEVGRKKYVLDLK